MRLRGAAPTRACGKLRGKAGGNCATRAQRAHSAPPGLRLAPEIRHLARALATAPAGWLLGPKSRKNCHESHERGKPTAIFSKRRKIDTL